MNFWQLADRYPPILVRLLARKKKGRPLTTLEVAAASGLPIVTVEGLTLQTDWSGVTLDNMRKFLVACGLDFENRAQVVRAKDYLRKKPTWKYLRVNSHQWKSYWRPLMARYIASVTSKQKGKSNANIHSSRGDGGP